MESTTFRVIEDPRSSTESHNDNYEGFQRGSEARTNFDPSRVSNDSMGLDMLLGNRFNTNEVRSESEDGKTNVFGSSD